MPDTKKDEEKEKKLAAGGKEEGKTGEPEINIDNILKELRRALSTEDFVFIRVTGLELALFVTWPMRKRNFPNVYKKWSTTN